MIISHEELARVTELTRRGQLLEATQAIQAALGARKPKSGVADAAVAAPSQAHDAKPFAFLHKPLAPSDIVDVPFRAVTEASSEFIEGRFSWGKEEYRYHLFVPHDSVAGAQPRSLVVMLHGCKQDAADFARGTAMNAIADQHNCLVLYPEQLSKANSMRCWNWFDPQHQVRDAGESGMIAALTLDVAARYGADLQRLYIAGLSAGGAMAAMTATLYPEVFAGLGIHSGLAAGSATDVASAFAAMRTGKRKSGAGKLNTEAVPTIVFQGTSDKTVAPANADGIVDDAIAAWARSGVTLEKRTTLAPPDFGGQRSVSRTLYTARSERVVLEHWCIAAGPHAWSGGNASGSFTDPLGPNASKAMLAFFLQHVLAQPT